MSMADTYDFEAAKAAKSAKRLADRRKANGHGSGGWQEALAFGDRGKPLATLSNATIALASAPEFMGVFAWNDFAARVEILREIPDSVAGGVPRELRDVDISATTLWLQRAAITVASKVTVEAIQVVATDNRFHPVRAYLSGLRWDQTPRLDMWLVDHLGVEDTPLHRAFGSKWMISLVARVMSPGCQADCALIIESRQGLGKSTTLRTLGGDWFTDHLPDLTNKDAMQQIQGVWIVELAELDSLRRAETHRIKSFISARVDRFRPPFGRMPADFPRQCGFAGTVNPGANGYLRDETGARRFWTVACATEWESRNRVDTSSVAGVRDQLWAEAMHRYRAGECWHLNTPDLEDAQAAASEDRREDDPRERMVEAFLWSKKSVHMDEILGPDCLKIPVERWNSDIRRQVGYIMSVMRWRRVRHRLEDGRREWRYVPP